MAAADSGEFAVKVSGLISDLERAATDIHCDDTTHELNQIHQSILQVSSCGLAVWVLSTHRLTRDLLRTAYEKHRK
jgi:hypothetical protein